MFDVKRMCRGVRGQEEDDVTGKEHDMSRILMSLPMSAGDVWTESRDSPLCGATATHTGWGRVRGTK